jgi:molybdenum ABC transporter molybdate-binding protein
MRLDRAQTAFFASLILLVALVALLITTSGRPSATISKEPIFVYCAAALRKPVEAIAQAYEKTYGIPIQLQFGGSQTLLANAELTQHGDLYLPADDSYIQLAHEKGLVEEVIPLTRMTAVLAVRKGNPKGIRSLEDLINGDAGIAQANPDAAAIGKKVREAFEKTGQWEKLKARTRVFKFTVDEVANDIKLGAIDAGFAWDATVRQYPELERVDLPELATVVAQATVGVLKGTRQPAAALRFARYLAASDRGLLEFERRGFELEQGDPWTEEPGITLFAGAMLRPAIEETITDFEKREGVHVTRVYNGCGILVAQMKAGERPDAYFACDVSFMQQVRDRFAEAREVSVNQLVILVPRGNPHDIHALEDLAAPGLRIGIGHEKQCALGALTQTTLVQGGLYDRVMKNVTVQSPTGDLLVNQLLVGSLDAVVAYVSNATNAGEKLEAFPVDVACALAVQPIAVEKESQLKQLSTRLIAALTSPRSQARFEAQGFQWKK